MGLKERNLQGKNKRKLKLSFIGIQLYLVKADCLTHSHKKYLHHGWYIALWVMLRLKHVSLEKIYLFKFHTGVYIRNVLNSQTRKQIPTRL